MAVSTPTIIDTPQYGTIMVPGFFFIARGWGFILRREGVFGGLSCGVFEKKSSLGVTLPPYSTYFKVSYCDYQTI